MKTKLVYINSGRKEFFVRTVSDSIEEREIQHEFILNDWIPIFEIKGWDNFKGYNGYKRTNSILALKGNQIRLRNR